MDHKLTREMQLWLNTPPQERSLEAGADILLRLNSATATNGSWSTS